MKKERKRKVCRGIRFSVIENLLREMVLVSIILACPFAGEGRDEE